jgi:hypothetical protein
MRRRTRRGEQRPLLVIADEALVQLGTDLFRRLVADEGLHRGVDPAGPEHVDRDAGAGQLGGEVEGVSFQGRFAGGVGVGPEHAGWVGGDAAGDVHDAAPPAPEHLGQDREGEPGCGCDIDRKRGGPCVRVERDAGAKGPDHGGVVDQHLDRSPVVPDRAQRSGDLVRVGDVRRDGERTPAAPAGQRDRVLHLAGRARQHGDLCAGGGQSGGHGSPDAPATPGHQGDPAVQRFA